MKAVSASSTRPLASNQREDSGRKLFQSWNSTVRRSERVDRMCVSISGNGGWKNDTYNQRATQVSKMPRTVSADDRYPLMSVREEVGDSGNHDGTDREEG